MKTKLMILIFLSVFTGASVAAQGLISIPSSHSVSDTVERLETLINKAGLTLFDRVDHSDRAKSVDLPLRPTQVVFFGNPKAGTPLMRCQQTVAIDLPQKALVWEDEEGKVWISYNDPEYLRARHAIEGCDKVLGAMSKALDKLINAAAN